MINTLLKDVLYTCRTLRRNPGFSLVAALTLALALGANTAIFSFVNAVLIKPLPYETPERIVRVMEAPPSGGRNVISTLDFLDWQKQNTCFEFLAGRAGGTTTLTGTETPVELPGERVSAHFFEIFGIRPVLGRTFIDGEDQEGKDKVAVLSYSLWQSQFAGDPDMIGRIIMLDGEAHTVIGVLPKGTPFERGWARIWRPLAFTRSNLSRNFYWFGANARLKPGVTLEQARSQMDVIGKRIADQFPESNKGWGVGVDLLSETIVGPRLNRSLYVLLTAVGLVLLIACANLANLSLMRAVGREREVAIRVALGASRWALIRQCLTESIVLSMIGGGAGLALGQLAITGLKFVVPPYSLPSEAEVGLDGRVLLFSLFLTLLTGVVVGLLPALQAGRLNLTNSLKQGGVGSSAGSHTRLRSALVVVEIALAFMLLTSAGLLIRSLGKMSDLDPGFDYTNVLTFNLPVSEKRYPDPLALNQYLREIESRLRTLPAVTDVALTSALPLQGWGYGMPFQISDQKTVDRASGPVCFFKMVGAAYFQALHMHLRQGRALAATDRRGTPPVVVINETMAKKFFSGTNPIGKRILVQEILPGKTQLGDDIAWEVVGVVADEKVGGLDDLNESSGMYVTYDQSPVYYISALVRSSTNTTLLREAVVKSLHGLNRDQSVSEMKTLETIKSESLTDNRFRAILLGTFAGLSLLLSWIGIYGVISYSVTQRTREMGIRTALGASASDILRLVLRLGAGLAGLGLVIGMIGSIASAQLLASLLFGITSRDPATLLVVGVTLGLVAILACIFPALRAAKIDPLIALRDE